MRAGRDLSGVEGHLSGVPPLALYFLLGRSLTVSTYTRSNPRDPSSDSRDEGVSLHGYADNPVDHRRSYRLDFHERVVGQHMAFAFLQVDRYGRRQVQKPIQSGITVSQSKPPIDGDKLRSGAPISAAKLTGVKTLPDRLHEGTFSVCLDFRQALHERA